MEILSNVFSLLLSFLEPSLRTWIPVLIAFGVWLKQYANLKGKYVPFAEILAGFLVAGLNCLGKGMGIVGVVGFIIGQGLLLSAFSMGLYDLGRAVIEIFKGKSMKQALQEVDAEALDVNKEETN